MVNTFDPWLKEFARQSEDPFVRDSEKAVGYFQDLDSDVPDEYGWRTTDVEAFKKVAKRLTSNEELNRFYWHDIARNVEAYDLMVLWRASELLQAGTRSLNDHQILTSALCGRALLELATTIYINNNTIYNTVKQVVERDDDAIMLSQDLEELLLKSVHGTRLNEPPDHLAQKNVLTYLKKLSKNPQASDVYPTYEYLCEVAHPNVVGNARFWSETIAVHEDGSRTLRMERDSEYVTTRRIREKVLWAFGWSLPVVRNGFEIGQSAVALIARRWPA